MKKIALFSAALALLAILAGCGTANSMSLALQTTLLPTDAVPLAAETVSSEQAKEITLKHAGYTPEEVTGLRVEYDREDCQWDVDFRAGNWEYEYDIHGITGAIMKADKEYAPIKPQSTEPPAPNRLSAAEVKAIALKHAGLSETQIRFLRIKFETSEGIPQYEVEFISDGWEYDYDIHAVTGDILSFNKDR